MKDYTSNDNIYADLHGPVSERLYNSDIFYTTSIIIDRSVQEVWPHFVDIRKWMTDFEFDTIEGEATREGEVFKVTRINNFDKLGLSPSVENPFHFCKIIRLDSLQQFVVKVFPSKVGGYGGTDNSWCIFDTFSAIDVDGKTHISFSSVGESDPLTVDHNRKKREFSDSYFNEMFGRYWKNLESNILG